MSKQKRTVVLLCLCFALLLSSMACNLSDGFGGDDVGLNGDATQGLMDFAASQAE